MKTDAEPEVQNRGGAQTQGAPAALATETETNRRGAVFEPLALVLLSLATVGTAWCSFQAAAWGGAAQGAMNQSTASARRAAANELQSSQIALLDVLLFSQYINARASSNETLARFYSDRFRGEAKSAFEAWMATQPFQNSNAPPHPFVAEFYHPKLLEEVRQAEAEAQTFSQKAGEAGRTSRNYILITVLLACALFCGGTAAKFDKRWIRQAVLALGLVAFLFAAQRLLLLPTQF
jgi:hypothetical protein